MEVCGRVVHYCKVALVLVKVVQFERSVGESQPKPSVGVGFERLHRTQQDDVAYVEFDALVNILTMEQNGPGKDKRKANQFTLPSIIDMITC